MPAISELLKFDEGIAPADLGWADYLFNLGARIAVIEAQAEKACILLILPTVLLAAPIITFGYIYQKLNSVDKHSSGIEYFEKLSPGCTLHYRTAEGLQYAIYEGIAEHKNHTEPGSAIKCIKVRIGKHRTKNGRPIPGGSRILMPADFHRVNVVSSEHKISERSVGKGATDISSLAKSVYHSERNTDMTEATNAACIVGKPTELEHEFTQVALLSKSGDIQGNFNDLIRVQQFLTATEVSFSRMVSCFKNDLDSADVVESSKLTVFRESSSYLKHQHNYKGSKILVLDFSDRGLGDAVNSYNQQYYNRQKDLDLNTDKNLDGVFCSGFLGAA